MYRFSEIEIVHEIGTADPSPPSSLQPALPPEFDLIIARALAKQKEDRFPTIRDFQEALINLKSSHREKKPGVFVAVLFFEDLSGSKEEEYFRHGMTEDIITELSKIKDLTVLPRSAVLAYKDKPVTAQQIGQALQVSFVLAGSVRRSGTRVRINSQLLDASSGHSVWAERYDREMKDILDIQEEIARSIAQALRIQLSPQEEKAIASKPTANLQAYDYYLRGRNFVRRATHADLGFAMQMFESAIGIETEFALAYAGLSNVCALFYDWYEPEERWVIKGLSIAETALALQPDLPEGHAARARILWAQRKYPEAIEHARIALQKKSDCEGAYWTLLQALFTSDRWQEAVDYASEALAASGDDYNIYVPLINSMGRLGRLGEVRNLRRKQMLVLRQQLQWVPEDVRARMLLATNCAFFGLEEEAVQELQKAVSLRPEDANLLYNAACTYSLLQLKAQAFDLFKNAVQQGFWNMEWAARDPDLSCLHRDPEFKKFIQEQSPQRHEDTKS